MKSAPRGRRTSVVEVLNVSMHGFWLWIDGRELFLAFDHFPWFRDASIGEISDVTRPSSEHLYWPKLDIDLALASIEHPEAFPLVSRADGGPTLRQARLARRSKKGSSRRKS